MFYLHQTNDLNLLMNAFEQIILKDPPEDPFRKEYVVVQTPGMRRWLSLEAAKREGVIAHFDFPNPTDFLTRLEFLLTEQREGRSVYDKSVLKWAVNRLLSEYSDHAGFEMIHDYLGDQDDSSKLYRLSVKVADLLDQYFLYRPQMLKDWNQGKRSFPDSPYEEWQMALWQKIREIFPKDQSRVDVIEQLYATVEKQKKLLLRYLKRVSFFGMSVLPPYYFQVLSKLAEKIDIHFFVLNPSPLSYWGDLLSRKQKSSEDQAVNGILANFGKMGQEFFDLIYEQNPVEDDLGFVEKKESALLSQLQNGIFKVEDPAESVVISKEDVSFRIECCHSPLREVEVLFDRLADALNRDETLTPADILVVTPDMETYAPYIDLVFAAGHSGEPHIPYTISDRSFMHFDSTANSVSLLLDLMTSRFEASAVIGLFEEVVEHQTISVVHEDMEKIRYWIKESGIRWGQNAEFRAREGLPQTSEYTWSKGIARLLTGYALERDDEKSLYNGELPFDEIEGTSAEILGIFLSFYESLTDFYKFSLENHIFAEWVGSFKTLLLKLFGIQAETEDDVEDESVRNIFASLDRIPEDAVRAGFEQAVSYKLFRTVVLSELEEISVGNVFLTGAVSFTSMVPMRSIPFRIIAVLGMNHGIFPRRQDQSQFNLMNLKPQKGDRNLSQSDRYLFLELLLSASDAFYLTYIGRDEQDNSEKPPSVIIEFLKEYLEAHFRLEEGGKILDLVETVYPLQPFSSRYGKDVFTYHSHWFEACEADKYLSPFSWDELPESSDTHFLIDGNKMEKILKNPPLTFLSERLGTYIPDVETMETDLEPFETDHLSLYLFKKALLQDVFNGKEENRASADILLRELRACGKLPVDALFEIEKQESELELKKVFKQLQEDFVIDSLRSRNGKIDLTQGKTRFVYVPQVVWQDKDSDKTLIVIPAKLSGKKILSAWLTHLFLNLEDATNTVLVTQGTPMAFQGLSAEKAAGYLKDLHQLTQKMMQKPFPFVPDASWEYIRRLKRPKVREKGDPFDKAMGEIFAGYDFGSQKRREAYEKFFYPERGVFDRNEFESIAEKVFDPVIENMESH